MYKLHRCRHHPNLFQQVKNLSASSADGLSGRQHGRGTGQTAVGDDAAGGGKTQLIELAAHARVVVGSAADLGDGGQDAGILFGSGVSVSAIRLNTSLIWVDIKPTPQRGMLSTSGHSAWRLMAGLAEATAARAATMRVEKCILAVDMGFERWVQVVSREKLGSCMCEVESEWNCVCVREAARTGQARKRVFMLFLCSFSMLSDCCPPASTRCTEDCHPFSSPCPRPLPFPTPHFVLTHMPSPC
jgi:hypothetical protein